MHKILPKKESESVRHTIKEAENVNDNAGRRLNDEDLNKAGKELINKKSTRSFYRYWPKPTLTY
jgi:hypothetical protein